MEEKKTTFIPLLTHVTSENKRGPYPTNQDAVNRLKMVEGQIRGIQSMVQDKLYCIDILNQISSVRSAMDRVGVLILKRHIEHCVSDAIRQGDQKRTEIIDELMVLLSRKEI